MDKINVLIKNRNSSINSGVVPISGVVPNRGVVPSTSNTGKGTVVNTIVNPIVNPIAPPPLAPHTSSTKTVRPHNTTTTSVTNMANKNQP